MSSYRNKWDAVAINRGIRPISRVYQGSQLVWSAAEPEPEQASGTGLITYVWDEATRSMAVQQTAASGGASWAYDGDGQELTVTGGAEPYV